MRIGVISNNDFCLSLLFFLQENKVNANVYLGNSLVVDGKRDQVKQFCANYHIPYADQMSKEESVYEWMDKSEPEVVFMIGHLEKIDVKKVKPEVPVYNIHFGKLPQYRGASPLFWQLKKMDPTIGCCIHALSDAMDAGPILWAKEIRHEDHFTHSYVQYLFSNILVEGVTEILSNPSGNSRTIQDETKAHWYPKPTLKDVLIRWDSMPANEICALIRACVNWNVGAITLYHGMEMKIIDAICESSPQSARPGTITAISDSIKVSCINHEQLSIYYLSLNGIPFPGREAGKFEVVTGETLTYPSD